MTIFTVISFLSLSTVVETLMDCSPFSMIGDWALACTLSFKDCLRYSFKGKNTVCFTEVWLLVMIGARILTICAQFAIPICSALCKIAFKKQAVARPCLHSYVLVVPYGGSCCSQIPHSSNAILTGAVRCGKRYHFFQFCTVSGTVALTISANSLIHVS